MNSNEDWLEEFKSQFQSQLKHTNRRKEELETNIKRIDKMIELRDSSKDIQDLQEINSRIRAENDQIRAELEELKLLMDQEFKH